MKIECVRFGDRAVRMARQGIDVQRFADAARSAGAIDWVIGEEHVAAYFDREPPESIDLAPLGEAASPGRTVELSVRYDGIDLASVCDAVNLTRDAVIAIHSGREYEVSAVGFLPGFAYMTALDPRLVLPRRSEPRARVPAMALAIAEEYTGIYPFASPGGWHIIGTLVRPALFDAVRGALLGPGDRVRFVTEAR